MADLYGKLRKQVLQGKLTRAISRKALALADFVIRTASFDGRGISNWGQLLADWNKGPDVEANGWGYDADSSLQMMKNDYFDTLKRVYSRVSKPPFDI